METGFDHAVDRAAKGELSIMVGVEIPPHDPTDDFFAREFFYHFIFVGDDLMD